MIPLSVVLILKYHVLHRNYLVPKYFKRSGHLVIKIAVQMDERLPLTDG